MPPQYSVMPPQSQSCSTVPAYSTLPSSAQPFPLQPYPSLFSKILLFSLLQYSHSLFSPILPASALSSPLQPYPSHFRPTLSSSGQLFPPQFHPAFISPTLPSSILSYILQPSLKPFPPIFDITLPFSALLCILQHPLPFLSLSISSFDFTLPSSALPSLL